MANEPIAMQQQLSSCAAQIRDQDNTDEVWPRVEQAAQALANVLRVKDGPVDNHTMLGATDLPQSLVTLFNAASNAVSNPREGPLFEILRVSANFCMEHDGNRTLLLDAGLPQSIVSLLEGYCENIPSPPYDTPLELSTSRLRIIRTAIGVLLNASLGHDAVKTRLNSLEAGVTILKLATAIYPPGLWASSSQESADFEENWNMRSGISNWAWRTISELKEVKDETVPIFGPSVLAQLTLPLTLFIPPYKTPSQPPSEESIVNDLLDADFDILEESCSLIESLSLDVEDVRLSLARGFDFPAEHGGVRCFSNILDFIERAGPHPMWTDVDRAQKEKSLAMCKAALIKSVVEVAGEDHNEDVLWDESNPEMPGGEFVCRMVEWIKGYISDMMARGGTGPGRDDLLICASLSLGNLARREKQASVLLSEPHSLATILSSQYLLSPETDIKVKHGVLGLLKHLAQACTKSLTLYEHLNRAGVVQAVCRCGIWDEKADAMSDIVQVGAIGIVKHMCNTHIDSTFAFLLPGNQPIPGGDGLSQILALVKRSDSVPVKSEGTRVLVNVVKSLWSSNPTSTPVVGVNPIANGTVDASKIADFPQKRQAALAKVLTIECATALASLVERSAKYPLLVNEGVVALSLLSTQQAGAPLVVKAILKPSVDLPTPGSPSLETSLESATNGDEPPVKAPKSALDMLVAVLKNVDNPVNFQPEVRMNVCSLLIQLGKNAPGEDFEKLKTAVKPVLEDLQEKCNAAEGRDALLGIQVKKVLDAWA